MSGPWKEKLRSQLSAHLEQSPNKPIQLDPEVVSLCLETIDWLEESVRMLEEDDEG